jgi:flagellar biosynthesis chaperone FliJ
MKRFRFSLEAVETIRARASREALENYARKLRARIAAESALAKAELTLAEHLTEWRRAMNKSFSPSDMLQNEHARLMLEARRNERAKELREAAASATQAYAAFQVARQKSDVVERFHERQRHEFNLGVLKEEQHFLDELASSRRDPGLFENGAAHV